MTRYKVNFVLEGAVEISRHRRMSWRRSKDEDSEAASRGDENPCGA